MIPSSVSTIVSLFVRIAATWVLSLYTPLGYKGIWWSIPIGWFFGMLVAVHRYRQGGWKGKAIVAGLERCQ